jgi:hypothetical protein
MMKILVSAAAIAACSAAMAKLPPPDDATKAKAAETAAKNAWAAKVAAYETCRVQDKIVALYKSTHGSNAAANGKAAAVPVAPSASAASAPGTPVAAKPPAPCADPGPFAYTPADQKPLEASGAHSPPGNANTPPSVRAESAKMVPAKK